MNAPIAIFYRSPISLSILRIPLIKNTTDQQYPITNKMIWMKEESMKQIAVIGRKIVKLYP